MKMSLISPPGVRVRLDGGPHVGASVDSLLAGFPVAVVFFARPFRGQGGRERGGDVHSGHVCVWVGAALFANGMRSPTMRVLSGLFLAISGGRALVLALLYFFVVRPVCVVVAGSRLSKSTRFPHRYGSVR